MPAVDADQQSIVDWFTLGVERCGMAAKQKAAAPAFDFGLFANLDTQFLLGNRFKGS
jgi:hypothetical protein